MPKRKFINKYLGSNYSLGTCQKLAGGKGGGIRGRVIFFSAIEKGRVRKKLARSFDISDTNLKEPGGGSQIFQPYARGGSLYFHHSIHTFHSPPPC